MNRRLTLLVTALALGLFGLSFRAGAGAFTGAGSSNRNVILHPPGYDGSGGELAVEVCLDPASLSLPDLEVPLRNAITTWNELVVTTANLRSGDTSDPGPDEFDWQSTVLHELGHCLGLAHPNLGSESGLVGSDRDFTRSTTGSNGFDLDPGADGIRGSVDDLRGDDVNLHWYQTGVNNPFTLPPVIDSTTYRRPLSGLPPGDLFAASGSREAAPLFGLEDTEAVMQQGAQADEDQRHLVADDVATLRLGMAGLDELAGTADDYTVRLSFGGVSAGCALVVRLIDTTGLASCQITFSTLTGNHRRINRGLITTGNDFDWFFNPVLEPGRDIFADGFESGDLLAWSATVP